MDIDDLFFSLDLDGDGELSGDDLRAAAGRQGWHWREAPLYAVLHRLTLDNPLPRDAFGARLSQMAGDPYGPYGQVLQSAPPPPPVKGDHALLIIDPQRSFTNGAWMRSLGPSGPREIEPIARAFQACASLLQGLSVVTVMFSRCPFPPQSYGWDPCMDGILDRSQPYFIKPGNSVLWPPFNGVTEWITLLLGQDVRTLVMGGCTLNSCVRVSAVEVQQRFKGDLQVVVDLGLCGARQENYQPSPLFNGLSSVESAIRQMKDAGVKVVERSAWG